jgi:ribonuclease HI
MDKGMGLSAVQPSASAKPIPVNKLHSPAAKSAGTQQVIDGYVKNGVVHLLEGDLPEGTFVKVIKQ